jgi:hypothetical protein
MKENYTSEEVNGLLDEFVTTMKQHGRNSIAEVSEKFKQDKGLIKPNLEVGKWYKDDYDGTKTAIIFIHKKDGGRYYYYGSMPGHWQYDGSFAEFSSRRFSIIPSTDKEVEEALIKEAKKRGFKEGVEMLWRGSSIGKCSGILNYIREANFLKDTTVGWNLFENGKWAVIVETPTEMTIPEIEEKLGVTNLKITK